MSDQNPTQPTTVVLGLGRSGVGAARLLQRSGTAVLVLESGNSPALQQRAQQLRQEGIAVQLAAPLSSATFAALAAPPERVIVSPGIRWDHPTLVELRQQIGRAHV